jgi:hypothetical protein
MIQATPRGRMGNPGLVGLFTYGHDICRAYTGLHR